MDCLNPPETGFYDMDDSETQAQRRFSWSLTGTLSMCLQDPSQLLPRHSKPDVPHSQPPAQPPLPAVLGLVDGDISTMGSSSLRDPGSSRGAAFPGSSTRPVPAAGFRICDSAGHSGGTGFGHVALPDHSRPVCTPLPADSPGGHLLCSIPKPAVPQLSAYSAVPGLHCRTRIAQTPLREHRRHALAARRNPE